MRFWMVLLAVLWLQVADAAERIALNDGQTVSFQIPAGQFTNDFYFDVPAGVRKFRLDLDGTPRSNTDMDMFVRYETTFPDRNSYGLLPASADQTFLWLADMSHFQSISAGNQEFVVVGEHGYRPATPGRWHVAIVNFSGVPVDATLRLELRSDESPSPSTIAVRFDLGCTPFDGPGCVCNLAPWNANTPPVQASGNPGATLGEQRRLAVLDAVSRISAGFRSEAPITVRACWDELEADETSAVLAQAGPEGLFINDPSLFDDQQPGLRQTFLPESHAWYAAAPSAKLAGTTFCRIAGGPCDSRVDVTITFNSVVDSNGLFGGGFYYGLNPPPLGAIDFIGIAMHEISHGLGFLSLVQVSDGGAGAGSEFFGRDDIFSRQLVDTRSGQPTSFSRSSNADRRAAMTSVTKLQWVEPEALASPFYTPRGSEPGVRIYAPSTLRPGSTLSHIDLVYRGDLMVPSSSAQGGNRALKLTQPMLNAVGWRSEPTVMPSFPAPFVGQWLDRDRAGHGIDFQRVFRTAQGQEIYTLLFYSYDQNGLPEWFLATGPLVDGVFLADADSFGNSLVSYVYDGNRSPPQRADGARRGQVRLDFNQALDSAACNDGIDRTGAEQLATFAWSLDGDEGNWCMEPLIALADRTAVDLTGTWYGGINDQGWGASVATARRADDTNLFFALLYYPDSQGTGRWGYALSEQYEPGAAITFMQRRGYCRTCPSEPFSDEPAGTLVPALTEPTQEMIDGPNRLGFEVQFLGPAGGSFARPEQTPLTLLSAPAAVPSGQ
ncbi:MAG: hypothetical protein R3F15_07805 [Lysobacterales bacterium]